MGWDGIAVVVPRCRRYIARVNAVGGGGWLMARLARPDKGWCAPEYPATDLTSWRMLRDRQRFATG